MSEQITTAAERQALPPGTVVLSSGGTIACRHVDLDGVLFGMDVSFPWDRLQLPLTVLYRPDQPQRTLPSRDALAIKLHDIACGDRCEPTAMGLQFRQADAVLALVAAQPTVAQVKAEGGMAALNVAGREARKLLEQIYGDQEFAPVQVMLDAYDIILQQAADVIGKPLRTESEADHG